jgi:predicted metal-dependent HD superfamily phosphohydrolase
MHADRLAREWASDMDALCVRAADAAPVLIELLSRHGEAQRRYHGAGHLVALFDLLEAHAPQIAPGAPSRLAVWWHDAIYDPLSRENESRSADLARNHLAALQTAPAAIDEVCRLILMTKNHWDGPTAGEGDLFLDADIAILGAPPQVYVRYTVDVRQEYAFATDDQFRIGRSAFLEAALARPRLFRTDAFESAFAAQARVNMNEELARLAGGTG